MKTERTMAVNALVTPNCAMEMRSQTTSYTRLAKPDAAKNAKNQRLGVTGDGITGPSETGQAWLFGMPGSFVKSFVTRFPSCAHRRARSARIREGGVHARTRRKTDAARRTFGPGPGGRARGAQPAGGDALSTSFAVAADATAPSNPPLNVAEANKDANGNIKVHDQGVVRVTGTVDVGNSPKVQDVNVTNDALEVTLADQGTSLVYFEEIDDFDEGFVRTIDIHKYARVRFGTNVNGSGTVEYFVSTDGGVHEHFEVDAGSFGHTVFLGEAAGNQAVRSVRRPGRRADLLAGVRQQLIAGKAA
jgi:hypothetical protein